MASLNRRSAPASELVQVAVTAPASGIKADSFAQKANAAQQFLKRLTTQAWTKDSDIERRRSTSSLAEAGKWMPFLILCFQSVGVVYGDIGTSFLYVIPSVFTATPTPEDVEGAVSLIVWVITALVLGKYALIVLRADDNGQGGAFALFSLLKRQAELGSNSNSVDKHLTQFSSSARPSHGRQTQTQRVRETRRQAFIESRLVQNVIRILVVIGVGAIMGDGVLTPATSIVSACEGINVKWPQVSRGAIDGIAIGIVVVLFFCQRYGTGAVGLCFSPVICAWLLANAGIGVYNIVTWKPAILASLSPHKWFGYFLRTGKEGWRSLGGVMLCVTGCEALFADLGHFSRKSIQFSWVLLAWPCLLLTYLGQGAYLSVNPDEYTTAYWAALPNGSFYPMWILATLASIIASQALISAAFQIVKQAIAQGFFPRFTVIHTSKKHHGQVYIPFICYVLGGLCIILIATFQTSLNLTKAYGLSVILDMLLTTHFATLVILCVWKLHWIFPVLFYFPFALIESLLLSATAEKVPTGGWFSLLVCAIYTIIMLVWFWGSKTKTSYFLAKSTNLSRLLQLRPPEAGRQLSDGRPPPPLFLNGNTMVQRLQGVAVYYTDILYGAPPALEAQVTRFPALHEVNVILTLRHVPVPSVMDHERLLVKELPLPGFYHVIARYGYHEHVCQDETFADTVLQRISMMLFSDLHEQINASAFLKNSITLPPLEGTRPRDVAVSMVGPAAASPDQALLLGGEDSLATPVAVAHDYTAYELHGEKVVRRRSAPVGGVAQDVPSLFSAARPHSSSQAFTDTSFQPAPSPEIPVLDAASASKMSAWALKVASGTITLPAAEERAEKLARDICALDEARDHSLTYVVGKASARSKHDVNPIKKYCVHEPFLFMVHNFTSDADAAFGIPDDKVAIVGLPYFLD